MSPTSSGSGSKQLSLMYDQLIYNTLNILGITTPAVIKPRLVRHVQSITQRRKFNFFLSSSSVEESLMFSAPKDIAVNAEDCYSCIDSCDNVLCELCLPCMSGNLTKSFHQAYREHQARGNMKRIFPNENSVQEKFVKLFRDKDKLSVKWFEAKCENDFDWC